MPLDKNGLTILLASYLFPFSVEVFPPVQGHLQCLAQNFIPFLSLSIFIEWAILSLHFYSNLSHSIGPFLSFPLILFSLVTVSFPYFLYNKISQELWIYSVYTSSSPSFSSTDSYLAFALSILSIWISHNPMTSSPLNQMNP